ncbi:MAG TPA: MbnP family protein [Saprospiraceae bacterium]|nr:MbnP family protein [Saprospiraceae bacterium]
MIRVSLLSAAFSMLCICSFAQSNVHLVIHHKLGDQDFAMNSPAKNNLDHDFEVTRLEYYISGITLIHDNGTATPVPDTYILVNAASPTEVELGSFPVSEIEAIHFAIGVDPEHNHLDPASFDPSHPLAPKSPSMHWGWTAGYRFLALEGFGGPQYNQLIQLHGLGDQNYIKARVNLNATVVNNEVTINLDADYTRGLENISVNGGVIEHSESGAAQQALENFRNLVFSPTEVNTGTFNSTILHQISLYPNPTADGRAYATVTNLDGAVYEMEVTDILGRQISNVNRINPNTPTDIILPEAGIYFVRLTQEGRPVAVTKLISQ